MIVTADDFGRSQAVNEAVESAHRDGVLTAASLMVAAEAADEAVKLAKRLETLAVGLHVVVVCGKPVLPATEIPQLVERDGEFETNLVRAGFRFFFLPEVRRQLAREIRAQFESFRATGLPLDHVNAHNHMHIHPTILGLIIAIGKDYGLKAIRLPAEPLSIAGCARPTLGQTAKRCFLGLWLSYMRWRLRRAGLAFNDRIFGMRHSGAMDRDRLLQMIENLPPGATEIYSHPARGRWDGVERAAAGYRFEDEYQALVDPAIRTAVSAGGARLIAFRDL